MNLGEKVERIQDRSFNFKQEGYSKGGTLEGGGGPKLIDIERKYFLSGLV